MNITIPYIDLTDVEAHEAHKTHTRNRRRSDRTHRRSPRYKAQRSERIWLDEPKHSDRKRSLAPDRLIGGTPLRREKFESKEHHKFRTLALLAPIALQEQFRSIFEEVEQYLGTVEEYLSWEDTGWASFLDLAREKADEGIVLALTHDIPELADFFAELVA